MKVFENTGYIERFRGIHKKFQQTFHTPIQNLQPFVRTILSTDKQIHGGCITIDNIVFEPKHLDMLLTKHSLSTRLSHNWSIAATDQHEIESFLQAALSDWVDFIFDPTPELFVIYADHDEYTTFYTESKTNLDHIVNALSANDFEKVNDYQRHL